MDVVQVQVAIGSEDAADRLIGALLDRRLVACGQRIGPIVSHSEWHGRRERAEEWLVLLKTTGAASREVLDAIAELHDDEVPEALVVPVSDGANPYLEWVATRVAAP
jgi:periplasmic divalent cation tolerance protein